MVSFAPAGAAGSDDFDSLVLLLLLELDALVDDDDDVVADFVSDPQPARARPTATTARAVPPSLHGGLHGVSCLGKCRHEPTVGKAYAHVNAGCPQKPSCRGAKGPVTLPTRELAVRRAEGDGHVAHDGHHAGYRLALARQLRQQPRLVGVTLWYQDDVRVFAAGVAVALCAACGQPTRLPRVRRSRSPTPSTSRTSRGCGPTCPRDTRSPISSGVSSPLAFWGFEPQWSADPPQCGALADLGPGAEPVHGWSASGAGGIVYVVVVDDAGEAGSRRRSSNRARVWTLSAGHTSGTRHVVASPTIDGGDRGHGHRHHHRRRGRHRNPFARRHVHRVPRRVRRLRDGGDRSRLVGAAPGADFAARYSSRRCRRCAAERARSRLAAMLRTLFAAGVCGRHSCSPRAPAAPTPAVRPNRHLQALGREVQLRARVQGQHRRADRDRSAATGAADAFRQG